MIATVNIYFDNRMSKDGEWYVKYVIYYSKKQSYVSTGIKLDDEDVAFLRKYRSGLTAGVRDSEKRNLWQTLYGDDGYLKKAERIVEKLGNNFSVIRFKEELLKKDQTKLVSTGLLSDLSYRAAKMKSDGDVGNESVCLSTIASLKRFSKKNEISYFDVDKSFLDRYEKWMLKEGKAPQNKKDKEGNIIKRSGTPASPTTISMYVRQIRTAFNEAIQKSPTLSAAYPFGKGKYIPPASRNIKKAIALEEIEKIIAYEPVTESERIHRDLWLFSYLSNGINIIDILNLKWSNFDVKKKTIEFVRGKTRKTKRANSSKVQIDLFPISEDIIQTWGKPDSVYIFPYFTESMSAERKMAVKNQLVKMINEYMRRIAEKLNITSNITTYTARHTFATVLLRSEVPLAFISQKLSHNSIKTTQDYLGSFEDDQSKKYLSALMPKKKEE